MVQTQVVITYKLCYDVATSVTTLGVMMPEIGIRQLKNDTSEILRSVREQGAEYVITYRGQPVAVLRPVEQPAQDADEILALASSVLADLDDDVLVAVEAAMRRRPDFFGERTEP